MRGVVWCFCRRWMYFCYEVTKILTCLGLAFRFFFSGWLCCSKVHDRPIDRYGWRLGFGSKKALVWFLDETRLNHQELYGGTGMFDYHDEA